MKYLYGPETGRARQGPDPTRWNSRWEFAVQSSAGRSSPPSWQHGDAAQFHAQNDNGVAHGPAWSKVKQFRRGPEVGFKAMKVKLSPSGLVAASSQSERRRLKGKRKKRNK